MNEHLNSILLAAGVVSFGAVAVDQALEITEEHTNKEGRTEIRVILPGTLDSDSKALAEVNNSCNQDRSCGGDGGCDA